MSLDGTFNHTATTGPARAKRLAPFSIRLSETDRARLAMEAAGAPLGAYIKAKLLDGMPERRKRRKVLAIEDKKALARALALLGRSDLLRSLQDMARAAEIGALALTPETEAELLAAIALVQEIRSALLVALGHRAGGRA
ncbi:hypothetical protein O9Z70_11895 [Devosia sp. YIM 151766]|uniref:hypothetical protein n=1 Tax=Devosia sp. YIM 151766 TaxID=3017325 RepID=UPI00255C9BF0|nr:hypothetical protein [Devosia sp. YIM 151766]WIY52163.1 hypothetical protein O9Z70_11895 [Devosia sp. YIM 151766]